MGLARRDLSLLRVYRTNPQELDLSRPTLCLEATRFAAWAEHMLAQVLGGEEDTCVALDRALLQLTKEYLYKASDHNHPPSASSCLGEVFEEKARVLFERQMSLFREGGMTQVVPPPLEKPSEKPVQELFIGEELDEDAY